MKMISTDCNKIEYNVLLDEFPTVVETKKAIQHLSSGKALGTVAITAKRGLPMTEKLSINIVLFTVVSTRPTCI